MKYYFILFVSLIIWPLNVTAQKTRFPKGGYKSYEEFKSEKPSITFDFKVEKRTKGDIKMNGGNDYKIYSDSIDTKTIKKEIYAVSTGDTLFINCLLQKAQPWYAKVLVEGKYLVFRGGIGPETRQGGNSAAYAFGAVGGAISGAKAAMLRYLYIMRCEDGGQIKLLNQAYLESIIKDYPDLFSLYQSEQQKQNEDILLQYVRLINSK
jgi:hypothetical protein